MNREVIDGDGGTTIAPNCVHVEERLLGAILLDPTVMDRVAGMVDPGDFYRDDHEQLARLAWGRYSQGLPISAPILDEELTRLRGSGPGKVGFFFYELMEKAVHSADAEYHAQVIRKKAITRDLFEFAARMRDDCTSNLHTAEELLSRADSVIFDLAERMTRADVPLDVTDLKDEFRERMALRCEGYTNGVTTGFRDVDEIVTSLRDANLCVLAARPAIGKTALALCIAANAAFVLGHPTLFFSLEMAHEDLYERLLSSLSLVGGKKFEDPSRLDVGESRAITRAEESLKSGLLAIYDRPQVTVSEIASIAATHQKKVGLRFLVIDYLSLIDGQPARGESRQEEVARVTRGLKAVSRTLNIPLLLICQLNREVEKRAGKPRLADLRESGQIEQEASVVMLLHRDFATPDEAEVLVAKNRFGRTGAARIAFRRDCTKFEDMGVMTR